MSRIEKSLSALKAQNRKALIPFVTAGFPYADITPKLMHGMVEGGADIIELGVPFSDPMADGPTIQRASERALARGMSLRKVFDIVREFRQADTTTPVVLMGYANPIEAMGVPAFVERAKAADVDGVLVVDYPPEECREFALTVRETGLDPVFLLAPTSSEQRFSDVAEAGSGYIYYVSLKGVTGVGAVNFDEVRERVARIAALGNAVADATAGMLSFFHRYDTKKYGSEGAPLHDPCTIAWLLAPELFEGRICNLSVETRSELTMGHTAIDFWHVTDRPHNVNWIFSVDADGFYDLLTERLARFGA